MNLHVASAQLHACGTFPILGKRRAQSPVWQRARHPRRRCAEPSGRFAGEAVFRWFSDGRCGAIHVPWDGTQTRALRRGTAPSTIRTAANASTRPRVRFPTFTGISRRETTRDRCAVSARGNTAWLCLECCVPKRPSMGRRPVFPGWETGRPVQRSPGPVAREPVPVPSGTSGCPGSSLGAVWSGRFPGRETGAPSVLLRPCPCCAAKMA